MLTTSKFAWPCGLVAAILCIIYFIHQGTMVVSLPNTSNDYKFVYVVGYIFWVLCFLALLIEKKSEPLFPKLVAVTMLMIKGLFAFFNRIDGVAYNICASMLFVLSASTSFFNPSSKVTSRTFASIGSILLLGCSLSTLKDDEKPNAARERSFLLAIAFGFLGTSCILPAKQAWFPSKISKI